MSRTKVFPRGLWAPHLLVCLIVGWNLTGVVTNADQNPTSVGKITFTDVTKAAGITFTNASSAEKKYIVESMNGGAAMFDFDGDGRLDIYLVNSYTVEAALAKKPRPPAALYRNPGNGKFEDVATKAGVADPGWAMGVSVADYDNDGEWFLRPRREVDGFRRQ